MSCRLCSALVAVVLAGCSAALPPANQRTLEIGSVDNELTLPGGQRQLRIPVLLARTPSESLSREVELQCDASQPQNSVVSLTRIRHRDALLGLNRRDPSLERSWSGLDSDLPPTWLQELLAKHCQAALPPAWGNP